MRIDDFLSKSSSSPLPELAKEQQEALQQLMAVIHFLNAHYLDEFPTAKEKLKALHGDRKKLEEWTGKNKHISTVEDAGHKALGALIDNQLASPIKLDADVFAALESLSADSNKGRELKELHRKLRSVADSSGLAS